MSTPSAGERELAARVGLAPEALASAREVLNFIAALTWPRPERVSLLARLARAARADVGPVLGGMALDAAPLTGLDQLIPLIGLAEKRVAGLARALAGFDLSVLSREARELHAARRAVAALRVENDALRGELDRLRAALAAAEGVPAASPAAVPLTALAGSVAGQVAMVAEVLRARPRGLRLSGVELRIAGAAAMVEHEVALDLAAPAGGSVVTLAFAPGGAAPPGAPEASVPDVRGYTPALARRKLQAQGLAAAFLAAGEETGTVREQFPAPGTRVARGAEVRLVVA